MSDRLHEKNDQCRVSGATRENMTYKIIAREAYRENGDPVELLTLQFYDLSTVHNLRGRPNVWTSSCDGGFSKEQIVALKERPLAYNFNWAVRKADGIVDEEDNSYIYRNLDDYDINGNAAGGKLI